MMVAEGDHHIAVTGWGCIAVAVGRCMAVAMGVGMMVAVGDRLAS